LFRGGKFRGKREGANSEGRTELRGSRKEKKMKSCIFGVNHSRKEKTKRMRREGGGTQISRG